VAASEKIVDGIGQDRVVDELTDHRMHPLVGVMQPGMRVDGRVNKLRNHGAEEDDERRDDDAVANDAALEAAGESAGQSPASEVGAEVLREHSRFEKASPESQTDGKVSADEVRATGEYDQGKIRLDPLNSYGVREVTLQDRRNQNEKCDDKALAGWGHRLATVE